MNIKEIEELIKFVAKSGVSEVELQIKDFKIAIKTQHKEKAQQGAFHQIPSPVYQAPAPQSPQSSVSQPAQTQSAPKTATEPAKDSGKNIIIKSPMIGTFYRTPSPDKPVFVNVGDEIKPGKILCIIEAMKLFNEIESEVTGRIVKVLVDNASPVEYDQPLFEVEPL